MNYEVPDQHIVHIKGKPHIKFTGLLAIAHDHGLQSIEARFESVTNELAIAYATVKFEDGKVFSESSDATPKNVNKMVAPHFARMALTRAKARALRDALNIDMVSIEEMGEFSDEPEYDDRRNKEPVATEDDVQELKTAVTERNVNAYHVAALVDKFAKVGQTTSAYVKHLTSEIAEGDNLPDKWFRNYIYFLMKVNHRSPEEIKEYLQKHHNQDNVNGLSQQSQHSMIMWMSANEPEGKPVQLPEEQPVQLPEEQSSSNDSTKDVAFDWYSLVDDIANKTGHEALDVKKWILSEYGNGASKIEDMPETAVDTIASIDIAVIAAEIDYKLDN